MHDRLRFGSGFVAALDQSGGSTPGALAAYGIDPGRYDGEEQMFSLMHDFRCRIAKSEAFSARHILGAILFKETMRARDSKNRPFIETLLNKRIVPFVKVDEGLESTADGVQLMRSTPDLAELCVEAVNRGVFGTKMRSVIHEANPAGICHVLDQQIEKAVAILEHGLVPILEPEISIDAEDRDWAERLLAEAASARIHCIPKEARVIWKLSIPVTSGRYKRLAAQESTLRLLALSGGLDRREACRRLAKNPEMIASFSRALVSGLNVAMSDKEFDQALKRSIEVIAMASSPHGSEMPIPIP